MTAHTGGDPDMCPGCRQLPARDVPAILCPGGDPGLERLQQHATDLANDTGLQAEVWRYHDRFGVTIGGHKTGGHTWQQTWTLLYGARLAIQATRTRH